MKALIELVKWNLLKRKLMRSAKRHTLAMAIGRAA